MPRIPNRFRGLAKTIRTTVHPIEQKFRVADAVLSKAAWQFLETDVDYSNSIYVTGVLKPVDSTRASILGFAAVEQGSWMSDAIWEIRYWQTTFCAMWKSNRTKQRCYCSKHTQVLANPYSSVASPGTQHICTAEYAFTFRPHGATSAAQLFKSLSRFAVKEFSLSWTMQPTECLPTDLASQEHRARG